MTMWDYFLWKTIWILGGFILSMTIALSAFILAYNGILGKKAKTYVHNFMNNLK